MASNLASVLFRALASTPPATLRLAALTSPLRAHTAALHATRMQFTDSAGGYGSEPSEKQVRYAQQLAQRSGLALPQDALLDRERCSAFIEEALGKSAPSARQIAFAESLAATKNEPLPASVRSSAKAISEYIDQNQHLATPAAGGRSYGGGGSSLRSSASDSLLPTDKQLLYAATLARQKQVGLSYEQLSDRAEISRFIDEMSGKGGTNDGAYNPANYKANVAANVAGLAAGMGSSAFGAVAGAAMASSRGGDGSPLDDQMLSRAERGGERGAELDAEMDDLFGPSTQAEGEEDTPLFREGQIPF